jgi:lipoyl(octanoyl) transferase
MPNQKTLDYKISDKLVSYENAVSEMEEHVEMMVAGEALEKVWILEHEDVYSAGVSARNSDLLDVSLPLVKTGRGGKITYHGPGMKIAYVMLNLKKRKAQDIKKYVYNLEEVIIKLLASFGIVGGRKEGRVGIWVNAQGGREDKIAAIGVRVRKWVTFHGIAINVDPDLSKFKKIVPCGISDDRYGVTSLKKLGVSLSDEEFLKVFKKVFDEIF